VHPLINSADMAATPDGPPACTVAWPFAGEVRPSRIR
jgi:hypothetical protein